MQEENWHKRHALGLACQLPDGREDAILIIRELQSLVENWLYAAPATAPKVIAMVRPAPECA